MNAQEQTCCVLCEIYDDQQDGDLSHEDGHRRGC